MPLRLTLSQASSLARSRRFLTPPRDEGTVLPVGQNVVPDLSARVQQQQAGLRRTPRRRSGYGDVSPLTGEDVLGLHRMPVPYRPQVATANPTPNIYPNDPLISSIVGRV